MDSLEQYFSRTDTPAQDSPVGRLITRLVEKRPELSLEGAREQAHSLLAAAARRKNYRIPAVLSAEQENRASEAFARFNASRRAA
jgi:hypothetical protein